MKVLMISGDKKMLEAGTEANRRYQLQKAAVEKLDVFIFPQVHSFMDMWHAARGRYDVVTVQDPFWRGIVGWVIARRAHARLNVQVHVDLATQLPLKHILGQIVLRHADSVRVVSEALKSQLIAMRVRAPISVLPIFMDLARFKAVAHVAGPPTVLWVGRFEVEKDPLVAVEIFKQVRAHNSAARFVMLGTGSLERSVRRASAGLSVDFPGWQDPARYLGTASAVLCTSPAESYGASIIEALAAGVPVVAPDVGVARAAGATVVPRAELATALIDVLDQGTRGTLTLPILDESAWVTAWQQTLA